MLDNLPCAVGYKNKESVYIAGNQMLAGYMGYASADDIIGLTDRDVKNDMVGLADRFIQQDKDVMQLSQVQHLDIGHYSNGDLQIHLSTKKSWFDEQGEIVGTVYTCFELNNQFLKRLYLDSLSLEFPLFFNIGGQYDEYDLSEREAECLFYLMRGYTAKEIGGRLSISQKTVENYIDRIKRKFACHNRSALIEKAIDLGFIFNLPSSMII